MKLFEKILRPAILKRMFQMKKLEHLLKERGKTMAKQLKQMLTAIIFLLFFISVSQALGPHTNPTNKEGTAIDRRACQEGGGTYAIDRNNRAVTTCTYPNGDVTTCNDHRCDTCDSRGSCRPGGRIVPETGPIKPLINTAPTTTLKDSGPKKPQLPNGNIYRSRPTSNDTKALAPTSTNLDAPSDAKCERAGVGHQVCTWGGKEYWCNGSKKNCVLAPFRKPTPRVTIPTSPGRVAPKGKGRTQRDYRP